MDQLADARERFMARGLHESDLCPDPIAQFERWYAEVIEAGLAEPDAMVVATTTPAAVPSARFVLLRGVDGRGFRFYTDGESQKARELDDNPHAALLFAWHEVSRQVRVSGPVLRLPTDEADRYFAARPRGSQVAASASHQSQVVAERDTLDAAYREVESALDGRTVPRPDRWTGFIVAPAVVEFWQGREFRFHDRLRYTAVGSGAWTIERLQP